MRNATGVEWPDLLLLLPSIESKYKSLGVRSWLPNMSLRKKRKIPTKKIQEKEEKFECRNGWQRWNVYRYVFIC
jgi:hypothetical protein